MTISVRRMDSELRQDFYRLHNEANGCGWCCCAAWWVPTWAEFSANSAEQNRRVRDSLFDRGEYDGYLGYMRDEPVAWCQVGPRDRLEKLTAQYQLAPDPRAWAITCFLVAPGHRRQGIAGELLAAVINDLRERGVKCVEAFPRRGAHLEEDDLWTGPEALFTTAGFGISREHGQRPVLRLDL